MILWGRGDGVSVQELEALVQKPFPDSAQKMNPQITNAPGP